MEFKEDGEAERQIEERDRRRSEFRAFIRQMDNPFPPKRDRRGRWLKGSCGNKRGRPRKQLPYDMSDPMVFAQSRISLKNNGETVEMTHKEAVKMKLLESALRGSVRAQTYLDKYFQIVDEMRILGHRRLDELEREWIFEKRGEDMPLEIENEIVGLRRALCRGPGAEKPRRRKRK